MRASGIWTASAADLHATRPPRPYSQDIGATHLRRAVCHHLPDVGAIVCELWNFQSRPWLLKTQHLFNMYLWGWENKCLAEEYLMGSKLHAILNTKVTSGWEVLKGIHVSSQSPATVYLGYPFFQKFLQDLKLTKGDLSLFWIVELIWGFIDALHLKMHWTQFILYTAPTFSD